jgi:hypothetical protein
MGEGEGGKKKKKNTNFSADPKKNETMRGFR